MAKVLIPTPLRQFADKQDSVNVAGATVGEVLSALTTQFPDLRKQLFNDEGKLRSFVNVYLNDEDIRYLQKDATPVKRRRHAFASCPASPAAPRPSPRRRRPTLSKDEILRYSRHLIMPEVGMEGQLKLKNAKVLLVGTGGLGAPLGLYLAAAGVGRIGLVDFDVVDFTNLQRQVIHGTKDVGRKKLDSAADTMLRHQSATSQIDKHEVALTSENALDILQGLRHHRRRHRQFPHALSGQRRLRAAEASPTSTAPFSASKARRPSSPTRAARAIAASIPSRHLPAWFRAAPKAACWEFCPASSA